MRIPNKFNGYSADGRRLYPGGGGGGPNTTYSQTSNIPEYARPYVEQMLGATQRQLFTGTTDAQGKFTPTGFNNFTPFGFTAQRDPNTGQPLRDSSGNVLYTNTAQQQAQAAVAPVSAGQQMATNAINQYVAPTQTAGASSIAGNIAGRSAASGYYAPLQAERFQLGSPQQVRSDSFTAPGVSQAYMSPYMQNVVNAQQREARRASDIQRTQNQAQAVQQGAFGGSRQAIMEAERQRNLGTQLGDIQAQGLQSAYQQGMGQFNAEQNAYLQAQQANQQANLQTGIQNLQAQQAAQAAQEASRQFGANLGLQGYGQSLQAAQMLGQLGQQQYQQDMGTIQAMAGLGAQEQAQQQAVINQELQNYATAQQYPLMQLGVMSNMLRGLPMQASTTNMYQQQPSYASQAAGAVGTGLGLVQQYNKAFPGGKEGGVVKMASGGIATGMSANELGAKLKGPQFTDDMLKKKAGDPQTDQATKDLVTAEMARRANLRNAMATGGIIAFKDGETVEDEDKKRVIERGLRRSTDVKRLKEDAKADDSFDDDMLVKADKELRDERIRRDLTPPPAAAPVDNQGIVAAASRNVSPVPAAPASAPAPSAGVTAAPQRPSYQDVEAANLEAGLGYPGQAMDPAQQAMLGLTQSMEAEKAEAKTKMDRSTKDLIKAYQQERKDADVPDLFQTEKDKLRQRKERGEESERETARNNLIRFLTKWGTVPGSAMRGMITAGSDLVDKMDIDEKHRQKFLNELDDIESKINSSEYARRLGDEERARKEKDEAGKLYYKLAHDLNKTRLDVALKDKDLQRALETQFLKNQAALAKEHNVPAIIQEVNIKSAELMQKYATAIQSGKITKEQVAAQALDYVLSKQPSVTSTAMTLPYKAEDLRLTGEKLKQDQPGKEATTGKTTAETEKLVQGQIRTALRARRNELEDAEDKGYKGEKGAKARRLLESEIAQGVRDQNNPKASTAPAATTPAKPALKWDPATGTWK